MSLQSMQQNVKHVVHLMLENRSFDHLLGWLRWGGAAAPVNNVPALRPGEKQFYGLDGSEWLPSNSSYFLSEGPFTYKREKITKITAGGKWDYCEMPASDPGEEFEHVKTQVFGYYGWQPKERRMKGFYLDYLGVYETGSAQDILGVFTPETLPVMNALAENYAVSDMWFSSVPTQTNPNRAFSLCGTSLGRINNNADVETYKLCGAPYAGVNTIFSVFNAFNDNNPAAPPVTWKLYARYNWHDVSGGWDFWYEAGEAGKLCQAATAGKYFTEFMFPKGFEDRRWGGTGSIDDFKRDVAKDALPSFSYLEPVFFPESTLLSRLNDYHPPESLFAGEGFVKQVFEILTGNPDVWKKTLLIITFDEHGGTYDHILPPSNATPPDDYVHTDFDFTRYGVRVPTLLISPWVTPGTVFRADYYPEVGDPTKLPYDHTSVLATLCKWKGINYRDGAKFPAYYLGARTAVAPTFEGVFTSNATTSVPKLTTHSCSVGMTGLVRRRELIRAISRRVHDLTGIPQREIAERGMVEDILNACESEEDLKTYFDSLAVEYGKRDGGGEGVS